MAPAAALGEVAESTLLLCRRLEARQNFNANSHGILLNAPSVLVCTAGPPTQGFQTGIPSSFGEFVFNSC